MLTQKWQRLLAIIVSTVVIIPSIVTTVVVITSVVPAMKARAAQFLEKHIQEYHTGTVSMT